MSRAHLLAVVAGLACTSLVHADSEWASPIHGNWSLSTNWNPTDVPNLATELATISAGPGAYIVTLDIGGVTTIEGLIIGNPEASLGLVGGSTLSIAGGIFDSDGTVVVNSNGSGAAASLNFASATSLDGLGVIVLQGNSSQAQLLTDVGITITNNTTIQGRGQIRASLDNAINGVIESTLGGTLELITNNKSNAGLMRVNPGTAMLVSAITIDNVGGTMRADGGVLELRSATVEGGTIESVNAGSILVGSSSTTTLDAVTLDGQLNINGGSTVQLAGSQLDNDGNITINNNGSGAAAVLTGLNSTTITGSGSLTLQGVAAQSQLNTAPGAVITIGNNQTVNGRGQVNAELINNGLMHANVNGSSMEFRSSSKTNNNTMRASGGGIVNIAGITINNFLGSIEANGGTILFPTGTNSILGGDIETINSGQVLLSGGTITTWTDVAFDGLTNINGGSSLQVTGGGLINNGSIVVNNNGSGSPTFFRIMNSAVLDGDGSVTLQGVSGQSQLNTEPGAVLTIGPDQTIQGRGLVNADLVNHGLMHANVNGSSMEFRANDKVNNDTIRASGGGIVNIAGITITNTNALIEADAGQILFPSGASTIIGGDIETPNSGQVLLANAALATFNTVRFGGLMNINGASTLNIAGNRLTNNGSIIVNNNGSGSPTFITALNNTTINGNGSVTLQGVSGQSQLNTAAGAVLTIGANQTIQGRGLVNADLVNNGLMHANIANGSMEFRANDKVNNDTIRASGGGIVNIANITIDNTNGLIEADAGQILFPTGTSTIIGGTIETPNAGQVLLANGAAAVFDAVSVGGFVNINGGSNLIIADGQVSNSALVNVNNNGSGAPTFVTLEDGATLAGSGTVQLTGFAGQAQLRSLGAGTVGTDQTVSGRGQISSGVINMHGNIAPGINAADTLHCSTTLNLSPSATFKLEIASPGSHDRLTGAGASNIAIDGTLEVTFISGYTPVKNHSFTFLTSPTLSGEFSSIVAPPLPGDLVYRITSTATSRTLNIVCGSDYNSDGVLDFFDILDFLALFSGGNVAADFNEDGSLDFFDVLAFLTVFTTGCP